MKHFYKSLNILSKELKLNEHKKYSLSAAALAIIHSAFAGIFYAAGVPFLFIYNVIIFLFYTGIVLITQKKRKYTYIFIATFIEILLHSMLVSILLGWNWGFMTYTLGLIPLSYYIIYTVEYFKNNLKVPALLSSIVFICYFVTRFINSKFGIIITKDISPTIIRFTYYFNITLTFLLLWIVSLLFSLEVYYMQNNLENKNNSLEQLANYDPLTKLLNRRSMDLILAKSINDASSNISDIFCVIMADIDDFKMVNDTYGHNVGDLVLTEVSNIITREVRDIDYICRWGGEEILILINAPKEKSINVANRICNNVAEHKIEIDDNTIKVTLTLGVAQYKSSDTVKSLIERADKCLYIGKQSGKNRVISD
ncbi:MAG: GGDEF domain-containing protein [Lachnospiraceae bacterium]|nr:GGDEF domain-containing protein [Lachnospiraceae bacterium]